MWIWQRVKKLEKQVKKLQKQLDGLSEEPNHVEAIGFHWEPHEYDEWEYEDEPYP